MARRPRDFGGERQNHASSRGRVILISPTAFKGTLSPSQAARRIADRLRKTVPGEPLNIYPLADGGDGTLDVLTAAWGGRRHVTMVKGPLGRSVRAAWAVTRNKTAVIEMARASGLALVRGKNRIMEATSAGTGELIKAALDAGCRTVYVGVGGTACADGGAGALHALGWRYRDANGRTVKPTPEALRSLSSVDASGADKRIFQTKIVVLCDVTNPLLGPRGSARTFGPQKGATPRQVDHLEAMLRRFARFAPRDVKNSAGAGAAGALAFGLAGFCRARLVKGTAAIMAAVKWDRAAARARVIYTGEGRLDETSFHGKVIGEIVKRRGRARVVAVCGSNRLTTNEWKARGLDRVILLKEFL